MNVATYFNTLLAVAMECYIIMIQSDSRYNMALGNGTRKIRVSRRNLTRYMNLQLPLGYDFFYSCYPDRNKIRYGKLTTLLEFHPRCELGHFNTLLEDVPV